MSGIAAIIRFDGGEVEPGAIERMTAAMDYRGPDGIAHWRRGPVALGHMMLRTTAESIEEVQPLANEDESLILIIDGWLSNWEELRGELLARGAVLRTRSDAELVLRAYEVWGEDCPKHIDGEFAFLIWDARRREAYCAGDHIGLKSLHYHWDGRQLVVASDIVGVLAGPGIEEAPNRGKIAEFLAFDFTERAETIWQGVMRAIPAHWMRFSSDSLRSGKYWEPPFEASIRYPRDEDYFEHYREVFGEAVRRSSRTHLPLSCDVSGGLDSSAVFAMAHRLRREGRLPAPGVEGYTYYFPDAAGTPHDEIEYARAVAAHVGERVQEIRPFLPELSWFLERGDADRTIAGYPNGAMAVTIGEKLVADGSRVILNGEGGDEWTAGSRFYYWEHLDERDWRGLVRSLKEDAASLGSRRTAGLLWRNGLAHHLPEGLIAARRRLLDAMMPMSGGRARVLSPELRGKLRGRKAARAREADFRRIRNRARRAMHMVMTDPFAVVVWDQTSRQSARTGYETRTPLYARRFIEFAFATPERHRLRGRTKKAVHIGGLRDLLPDMVADRTTKAEFSAAFQRHFAQPQSAVANLLDACRSGMTDVDEVARIHDRFRRGAAAGLSLWHVWTIAGIEGIYASVEGIVPTKAGRTHYAHRLQQWLFGPRRF